MDMNSRFLEGHQIKDGGSTKWALLGTFRRMAILVAAAGVQTITLQQATDDAGDGNKALNFTRYEKRGATDADFTTVLQAAANSCTTLTADDFVVIDIMDTDLDINNGYCAINAVASGSGVVMMVPYAPVYAAAPSLMPAV